MERVKIYGERNTGTNFLARLIRGNFRCQLVPGTLAEARPGYRERLEEELAATIADEAKRMWARQVRLDQFFEGNLWTTLGWKHCVPRVELVLSHPEKDDILFVTVTKNPYAWVLSLFRRPYGSVASRTPGDLLAFIREPWMTLGRENAPAILASPVELWNLKNDGYARLARAVKVVRVRYEDVLAEPAQLLGVLEESLERRRAEFVIPNESTKTADAGKKDLAYYRDYYLKERWREELSEDHVAAINEFLAPAIVRDAGYDIIE
jgi:hypothetical protein